MRKLSWRVEREERGWPLQDFLVARMGGSRRQAKEWIDRRCVFVNNQRTWMARHRLATGDRVEIHGAAPVGTLRAVKILYQDEAYLIADKPPGVVSAGPDSLELLLRDRTGLPELRAAHRLDRDTSGCNLLARTEASFEAILPLFKTRSITKVYHAIVAGRVPTSCTEITTPVDNEPAVTRLQVLDANRLATHVKILIETGRTHQIRQHMRRIRHPVAGDSTYSLPLEEDERMREVPRQMLHARRLVFRSPVSGTPVRAESPLPVDFRDCLRLFRLK